MTKNQNLRQKKGFIFYFAYFGLVINILFAIYHIINKSIIFDIDVARDFLIMDDILTNHHVTLIGARTAIQGVFHGPFWIYINIIPFILSGGNPYVQGVFWLFLFIILLYVIFLISKQLFDYEIGLIASALLSSQLILQIISPTNPFAALFLFPIFFYLFIQFLRKNHIVLLIFSLFILGLIIQSEAVFGIPIAILSFVYLLIFNKKNLFISIVSFCFLLIPLSFFIVFELKHQFLQSKSFFQFLLFHNIKNFTWGNLLVERFKGFYSYGLQLYEHFQLGDRSSSLVNILLNFMAFMIFVTLGYLTLKKKFRNNSDVYRLSLFFYSGFWFLTLFTSQTIHWYYYLPFTCLTVIIVASMKKLLSYQLFIFIFMTIMLFNAYQVYKISIFSGNNAASWNFQKKLAQHTFDTGGNNFGYFINTYDQISSYLPIYALKYVQKLKTDTISYPFQKRHITLFVIGPYPDRKPLDNKWWKINRARIKSEPIFKESFGNGYVIEKYVLNQKEIQINPDSTIFQSLQFR